MLRVVHLVHLQGLFPPDDDQCLVDGQPQHLVLGQHRPLPHAAGLPELRRIVGDPPRPQLLRPAGDRHAGKPGAGGDKLRRQGIGTP